MATVCAAPGQSAETLANALAEHLRSWLGYFSLTEEPEQIDALIESAREHTRAALWAAHPPAVRRARLAAAGFIDPDLSAILASAAPSATVLRRIWPRPFPDLLGSEHLLGKNGSRSGGFDYAGRMSTSTPAAFQSWKATTRVWAARLWNRRDFRVGLDFGRRRGSWLPSPRAIRVTLFGLQFRLRL